MTTASGRTAQEAALEENLGVVFNDIEILRLALTHRSYAFEQGLDYNNERLEFLGDSILGVIITTNLYRDLPDDPEGNLAKIRAATVSTRSLALVATVIDLGASVRLGVGEAKSGGANKPSILADTLEAVIGAIYLDQGLAVTEPIVMMLFQALLNDIISHSDSLDYKTSLQELSAAHMNSQPVYLLSESGPQHEKTFTATVTIDDEPLGTGTGRSKKAAEQEAAAQAYKLLCGRLEHNTTDAQP